MKTIKLLIILLVFNTSSIFAQDFKLDARTIKSLNETGLDFTNLKKGTIYLVSKKKEIEKFESQVNLQILKSIEGKFIDDELPEGGFDFKEIVKNTSSIWECKTEGVFVNQKGLYYYLSNKACKKISGELIPGGDMFIPGGDMFIPGGDMFVPGGDTFVPGGDTFSSEDGSYYFLKISFKGGKEIAPAILPLKIK